MLSNTLTFFITATKYNSIVQQKRKTRYDMFIFSRKLQMNYNGRGGQLKRRPMNDDSHGTTSSAIIKAQWILK